MSFILEAFLKCWLVFGSLYLIGSHQEDDWKVVYVCVEAFMAVSFDVEQRNLFRGTLPSVERWQPFSGAI